MYFRLLNRHDYFEYIQLLNEFRQTDLTHEQFNKIFNDVCEKGQVWLLINSETRKILGTGTIIYETKFIHNGGIVAHIEDIIIKTDEKGKGFGKILLEHLILKSKEKKCYKVILNCSPEVSKFYEKCGFTQKNFQMEIRNLEF